MVYGDNFAPEAIRSVPLISHHCLLSLPNPISAERPGTGRVHQLTAKILQLLRQLRVSLWMSATRMRERHNTQWLYNITPYTCNYLTWLTRCCCCYFHLWYRQVLFSPPLVCLFACLFIHTCR